MKQNHKKREEALRAHHTSMLWTRFGMVFLGLWLAATPVTFGYIEKNIYWSDLISGIVLILMGLISMSYRRAAWIYGGAVVGVWLQLAPLVFWAHEPAMYINDTLIGIIVLAFCLFVPMRPKELDRGPMIPPGWSYNPSSWQQRIVIAFLVIIAWFLSRYMASFQLHYIYDIFDPFFGSGTEKVITSIISQDFPVADAGLGALAYSLEAVMVIKGGVRRWHTMPWIVLSFGVLAVPVGLVSILLIMMQPIAVGAWCGICILIAICMLLILALSVDEVVASLQYLSHVRKEKKKAFWRIFFMGSEYESDGQDQRTPVLAGHLKKNIQSMFWGITFPPHLLVTALLGVALLFLGTLLPLSKAMSNSVDVLAALVIVFSVIAWAEVLRSFRFINIFLGLLIALLPFIIPSAAQLSIIVTLTPISILIIVCSCFKGKIKERYGNWDSMIK